MSDEIQFETIEAGSLLKWENIGTKVVGILRSYKEQKTAMGQGHVYEVQTNDALVPFFAPSLLHKDLQRVEIGKIVSIEYIKKSKTGAGTDLKHFKVGHAPANEVNCKALGIKILVDVAEELGEPDLTK